MLNRLLEKKLDAELIVTFLFIAVSALYITKIYGVGKLLDTLFLWVFPASVMIFLSLLLVKIIENFHNRKVKKYKYVDWRK